MYIHTSICIYIYIWIIYIYIMSIYKYSIYIYIYIQYIYIYIQYIYIQYIYIYMRIYIYIYVGLCGNIISDTRECAQHDLGLDEPWLLLWDRTPVIMAYYGRRLTQKSTGTAIRKIRKGAQQCLHQPPFPGPFLWVEVPPKGP